jgi:hypothetical protein
MRINKLLLQMLILLVIMNPALVLSQVRIPGVPYSFTSSSSGRAGSMTAKKMQLKKLDNAEEIRQAAEIKKGCEKCGGDYYGSGIDVNINIKKDGNATKVDGGTIWKLSVNSETALGMQFYFNKYKLPTAASLFIYNEDHTHVLGAFTHINNHPDEAFATQIVNGKSVTLEYFEADVNDFSGELEINTIIHVFRNRALENRSLIGDDAGYGKSQEVCERNVICAEGIPFANEKKAVCRILYYDDQNRKAAHCSGFLVNNTNNPRKALVITADHCLHSLPFQAENPAYPKYRYSRWLFEFDYESATCAPGADMIPINSTDGAVLVTRGFEADYAVLDLEVQGLEYLIDVNYLGWNRSSSATFNSTVGIHHPMADLKKISLAGQATQANATTLNAGGNRIIDYNGSPKSHWAVTWNSGITEFSSSGSPLIDKTSKLAIGQLSAGSSYCYTDPNHAASSGPDFYGRFAHAWNTFDDDYSFGMGHYLDPAGTTQVLQSYLPNPVDAGDPPPGGGNTSGPHELGVELQTYSYMLGDFSHYDPDKFCAGIYPWRRVHGFSLFEPWRGILLRSFQSNTVDPNNPAYTTGIARDFTFKKGTEYIISMQVYGKNFEELSVKLTNQQLDRNCDNTYYTPTVQGQTIMSLPGFRFKDTYTTEEWWTFAQKFVPDKDYKTIYLRATANRVSAAPDLWLNYVKLHEKGHFVNPLCDDELTFYDATAISANEQRNLLITAYKNGSVSPVFAASTTHTLQAHQINLKPGFTASYGTTFIATAGDCFQFTSISEPIGPLEKNKKSSHSRSATAHFVSDYSAFANIHEGALNPVETAQETSLLVSPNPASNRVSIVVPAAGNSTYQFAIADVNGRVLFTKETSENSIEVDLTGFTSGLYLVQARNVKKIFTEKLVVK